MSLSLLPTNAVLINQVAVAVYGVAPGATLLANYEAHAKDNGIDATLNLLLNSAGVGTDANFNAIVLNNLGLSGEASAVAYMDSSVAASGRLATMKEAFSFLGSVAGQDNAYGTAGTAFNSKVTKSIEYSAVATNTTYSSDAISAAAIAAGSTFTLTTGIDNPLGGAGSDGFSASNTSLNAGDIITGGAGSDTLSLNSAAAATLGGFTSSGVETISVASTSSTATDVVSVNMGGVSDETALRATGSSSSVTFTNTDTIVPLTMSYNSAGNVVVTYNAAAIAGSADEMAVDLISTANGTLDIGGVETLKINNTGTSSIDLLTADATTISATGSGKLTLTDVNDTMTTLNLSAFTGTSITDGIGAVNTTLTGGSGNDTFKLGITLTKDDVIDGGEGADTLVVNNTDGNALTVMPASANVSNVETIRLEATDDSAADAFTMDASVVKFANITIDASDENDTYTFTKITDESISVTESANNAVALIDVSLSDATGTNDALTLNVTNADAATALTITDINSTDGGIETLNLVLNQGKDITGASDIVIADVSSTHSGGVVITGAADVTVGSGAAFANKKLDASAATGDFTVTVGTASSTITTGSGKDSVTFDAAALTSADTVNLGDGTDTLNTGNLAGGTMGATITGAETIKANFGTAGATIDGTKITGTTAITVIAASDENATLANLGAEVATVRIGNSTGTEAASIGYVSTADAAHTVNIGDDTKTADVDLGAITVTGNKGALTVNSDNFTGNSIFDLTANTATALTINTTKDLEIDDSGSGNGTLNAQKATSVDINVTEGALVVDGAQDLRAATSIDIDADQNTTLTGAMTATKATSLTVHASAGAAFEQTGNFTSDDDVSLVSLTADGASASVRYNGILDVDHVKTIDLVATGGGDVTVDDIELLGVEKSSDANDIDTALNITATGANGTTGSNVTVSAINVVSSATLDTVTLVSDADATINFTAGGANLTITTFDASASLGTNVIDTSTSGAAVTLTMGAAKKNTITTEINQQDTITLSTSAGKDVIKVLDDTSAVDLVSNFKGGEGGDVIDVDVSALSIAGTLDNYNTVAVTLANKVVMNTDDDGVATAADYTNNTLNKEMNILKLTNTFADIAAVYGAIDLDAGTELDNLADDDEVLVLWTNGADSFLSNIVMSADDGASADAGANLIQLVGVDHTTLTADNFNFV